MTNHAPVSSEPSLPIPSGYKEFLEEIKARIREAQIRASLSVNKELVLLYWSIGKSILDKQALQGWGSKIIDRMAQDLTISFPGVSGFSIRNLKYTESDSRIGRWQGGAPILSQRSDAEAAKLKKFSDADGIKSGGITEFWHRIPPLELKWQTTRIIG